MGDIRLTIHDGSTPADTTLAHALVEYPAFRLLRRIFKNGRQHEAGETIRLHPDTAAAFIAAGDLEENIT